jgi:hypothetical protein
LLAKVVPYIHKAIKGLEEEMEIKVQKLNNGELKKRNIFTWPVWEKEVSQFD